MSPGGKIVIAVLAGGAAIGVLLLATRKASAKSAEQAALPPGEEGPPDVIVSEQEGGAPSLPSSPVVAPMPPLAATSPGFVPPPLGTLPALAPQPMPPLAMPMPPLGAQPAPMPVPAPMPMPAAPAAMEPAPMPPPVLTVPLPPIMPQAIPAPAPAPLPAPAPVLAPAPAPVTPSPVTTVSGDTARLVAKMLEAEKKSGWNTISAELEAWQKSRPPLVADGKYGMKSALKMGEEIGTVPIVRFWPKGSTKAAVLREYRAALFELANGAADAGRAEQLRFAADREQGQSFGIAAGKAPAIAPALQVSLAKVA